MEVPDLLGRRLDAEPRSGVALGGEDVAVITRDRTFIYREEGLLSDATVEVYGNDIERLSVSQGRRKTTFHMAYLDDTRQFAVANNYAEAMLEGLFGGVLASADVLDNGEELRGVYLFSDLTVVVTDARLVKHIGTAVWEADAETYPFEAVTGLDFEDGAVATQVVLWVEGRAERIKAPNEEAPLLRRTLTRALCGFHSVDSLEQLNDVLGASTDDPASDSSIALEEDISPLIDSDDDNRTETDTVGAVTDDDWLEPDTSDPRMNNRDADNGAGFHTSQQAGDRVTGRSTSDVRSPDNSTSDVRSPDHSVADESPSDRSVTDDSPSSVADESPSDRSVADDAGGTADDSSATDIEALERQVRELRRAVDRQNELLEQQTEHIATLVERLDPE